MHEEQTRLLIEHMAVHRRDFDAIVAQRANYGIHFVGAQHEIAGDSSFSAAGRLKIDGGGDSHRRRNFHSVLTDRLAARNAQLVDSTVAFSGNTKGASDSQSVEVGRGSGCG